MRRGLRGIEMNFYESYYLPYKLKGITHNMTKRYFGGIAREAFQKSRQATYCIDDTSIVSTFP